MALVDQYTGKALSQLFGLSRSTIQGWRKIGLLPPKKRRGPKGYSFSDLLAIKAIKRLQAWGASTQQITRAVAKIKRDFKEIECPLIEKTLFVCGGKVCMLLDGYVYEPESKQKHLLRVEDYKLELRQELSPFKKVRNRGKLNTVGEGNDVAGGG